MIDWATLEHDHAAPELSMIEISKSVLFVVTAFPPALPENSIDYIFFSQ